MGLAVVTVASGGLPVVDVTAIAPKRGLPVTEAANGRGVAVTKVTGRPGLPVVYVAATLQLQVLSNGEAGRSRARPLAGGQTQRAPGAL